MRSFANIFKNPLYVTLATAVGLLMFALATLLPNRSLLFSVLADSSVAFESKITLPISLLGSIATNFTPLVAFSIVITAVLVGVNAALIVQILMRGEMIWSGPATGATGIFSGILGVGCAACGSLILSAILGTAAGASIIAVLPLRGGEFGIIGILLLLVSTYLLGRQILRPPVCEIN